MISRRVALMVLASLLSMRAIGAQEPGTGVASGANQNVAGLNPRTANMTMPKVVTHTNPTYTEAARKEKIQGDCLVALVVDAEGVPQDVRVVRSISETNPGKSAEAAKSLDDKAVEAVRQYRFTPAMSQGKAVPVALKISVNFQIF